MMRSKLLISAVMMIGLSPCMTVVAGDKTKLVPLTDADFRHHRPELVELGRNLFFDKILSGNLNISCATCHHPLADTGDGLSLPIGEGGHGLGAMRSTGDGVNAVHERVPRNSPPVFNLGAHEFEVLFHDGRVAVDSSQPSGFLSPAGNDLPSTLESVLAVQAMFPVTSPTEMAGQAGENPIADAAVKGDLAGPDGVWEMLAERLRDIPEYLYLFKAAYDDIYAASDITFAHAANAIAAFEGTAWRADNSPFDRFLRGERQAISNRAREGMILFYKGSKKAQNNESEYSCGSCHSGRFQTDQSFHAIAMPQIGPGKGDGMDGHEDFGRERVTNNSADRYKFRTPSLRNVALTAPYGHSGCYDTLRAVVEHHIDAVNALYNYDRNQAVLPQRSDLDTLDFLVMNNEGSLQRIADASEIQQLNYSSQDIDRILDFLYALTDPASMNLHSDIPKSVPSGLPVTE